MVEENIKSMIYSYIKEIKECEDKYKQMAQLLEGKCYKGVYIFRNLAYECCESLKTLKYLLADI